MDGAGVFQSCNSLEEHKRHFKRHAVEFVVIVKKRLIAPHDEVCGLEGECALRPFIDCDAVIIDDQQTGYQKQDTRDDHASALQEIDAFR